VVSSCARGCLADRLVPGPFDAVADTLACGDGIEGRVRLLAGRAARVRGSGPSAFFAVQVVVEDATGGVRTYGNPKLAPGLPERSFKRAVRVFTKLRFAR
jgi:hypothetical protein